MRHEEFYVQLEKRDERRDDLSGSHTEPERYTGRPLLIILENYVLDCIGELTPDQQTDIASLVQPVFGGGTDWKKTMREVLHLEASIDDNIKEMWKRNQIKSQEAGVELHPVQYAKMFVDSNFSHLVEQTGG